MRARGQFTFAPLVGISTESLYSDIKTIGSANEGDNMEDLRTEEEKRICERCDDLICSKHCAIFRKEEERKGKNGRKDDI